MYLLIFRRIRMQACGGRKDFNQKFFLPPRSLYKDKLLFVLALLVSNTARCLASGLARCLALTAATVLCCLAKVLCIKCLNTLHSINPPIIKY